MIYRGISAEVCQSNGYLSPADTGRNICLSSVCSYLAADLRNFSLFGASSQLLLMFMPLFHHWSFLCCQPVALVIMMGDNDDPQSRESSRTIKDGVCRWIHQTANTTLSNPYEYPSEIDVSARTDFYASSQRSSSPTVRYPYSDGYQRDSTEDSSPSISDLTSSRTPNSRIPSRLHPKASDPGPGVTQPISPLSPLRRFFTSRRSIFSDDASVRGIPPPSYRTDVIHIGREESPSTVGGSQREDFRGIRSTSPQDVWSAFDEVDPASITQTSLDTLAPCEPHYRKHHPP
jgi:hypothetical protein